MPKRAVVDSLESRGANLSVVQIEDDSDSTQLVSKTGLNLFSSGAESSTVEWASRTEDITAQAANLAARTPRQRAVLFSTFPMVLRSGFERSEVRSLVPNESMAPEEVYLSRLLGRRLTMQDREEYYWEEVDPHAEHRPKILATMSGTINLVRKPIELIGRMTMHLFRPVGKALCDDGDDTFEPDEEMNKTIARKRRAGGLSDFMISIVAGVLIATVIVFPVLKVVGREVIVTIAKSTVRKIGDEVSIQHGQDSSILLPFLSEQMLHPKHTTLVPSTESAENQMMDTNKEE